MSVFKWKGRWRWDYCGRLSFLGNILIQQGKFYDFLLEFRGSGAFTLEFWSSGGLTLEFWGSGAFTLEFLD